MVKEHARALSAAFLDELWPSIQCPVCQSGVLQVPKKADKPSEDDGPVRYRWRLDSYEDPTDIKGVFTMHLRCTKGGCESVVAVSGDMFVERNQYYDSWDSSTFDVTFYQVRSFYPPVLVAEYPDNVPDVVVDQLRRVGALIWMDAPAAMTAVRSAVEALMTAQGVSATTRNDKFRSLDDRLDEFARSKEDLALFLRAAKWVGNEGTHVASTVKAIDVLDMVEYVEIALSALYAPDRAAAVARAGRILAAKRLVP